MCHSGHSGNLSSLSSPSLGEARGKSEVSYPDLVLLAAKSQTGGHACPQKVTGGAGNQKPAELAGSAVTSPSPALMTACRFASLCHQQHPHRGATLQHLSVPGALQMMSLLTQSSSAPEEPPPVSFPRQLAFSRLPGDPAVFCRPHRLRPPGAWSPARGRHRGPSPPLTSRPSTSALGSLRRLRPRRPAFGAPTPAAARVLNAEASARFWWEGPGGVSPAAVSSAATLSGRPPTSRALFSFC